MNTLTRLDKIADTLYAIADQNDDGLELVLSKKRIRSLHRIAGQIRDIVADQRDDIAAEAMAAKEAEEAARQEAIEYVTQVAEEHGLSIKVLSKPAARDDSRVRATSAEIRLWANENGVEVNPLGIIPKKVRAAYDKAHA